MNNINLSKDQQECLNKLIIGNNIFITGSNSFTWRRKEVSCIWKDIFLCSSFHFLFISWGLVINAGSAVYPRNERADHECFSL